MTKLERTIGLVLRIGVTTSTVTLALGLLLLFAGVPGADLLLRIGTLTLLATPVARVVVSIVEYTIERDWTFVTLTAIVLVELLGSALAALVFHRRL